MNAEPSIKVQKADKNEVSFSSKRPFTKDEELSAVNPLYGGNTTPVKAGGQDSVIEKGTDASAAVMSIIVTVNRNKPDVYGYLTHLLTVLPECGQNPSDEQFESVMLWNESLPDLCGQEYHEIRHCIHEKEKSPKL